MGRRQKVLIVLLTTAALAAAAALWIHFSASRRSIIIRGAVLVRSPEVDKQVPIADVKVSVADSSVARSTCSSATGFFALTLRKGIEPGQAIILEFRHPNYSPLDLTVLAGDRLKVARLEPLQQVGLAAVRPPPNVISNLKIRYSVKRTTLVNVGSVVKTFDVVNTGNVRCKNWFPCSPDGRWKASIGSAHLDAPAGDVFSDARVSCIAGPCPFTRIRYDGFSGGGSTIRVAVLDWSDTTTFLMEAEVFRSMVRDDVRTSYPVVFGQTLHFSVPSGAEGVCVEADLNRDSIVFPLGPVPFLSWAACTESVGSGDTATYQCELKPGYGFQ